MILRAMNTHSEMNKAEVSVFVKSAGLPDKTGIFFILSCKNF